MLNKIPCRLNKTIITFCTATTFSLILAACGGSNSSPYTPNSTPVAEARDVLPSELTGVWEKRGYGQVVEFTAGVAYIYQHNNNNCMLDSTIDLDNLDASFGLLTLAADEQVFETKPENIDDDTHPYAYSKLQQLPETCVTPLFETNDPVTNYEVLWHNFNERYALFDNTNRTLDWNAINQEFREQIEQAADDEELFDLLRQIIVRTKDGHSHIKIEDLGIDASGGELPNWFARIIEFFETNYTLEFLQLAFEAQNEYLDFDEFVNATFNSLFGELLELNAQNKASYIDNIDCAANDKICFGTTNENIGYLAINQMANYAYDGSETAEDLNVLSPLMDNIINAISDTQALIIDIRRNSGGQDTIALEIAGYFISTEQLAFSTKARDKDEFANEYDVSVIPKGNIQYTKPIYLLIDNGVMSAAEIFAMTLKEFPQVTLIGESTFGIFSDAHSFILPIGWEVTMSNEIRSDIEGNVFEGIGIPADHIAQSLIPEDVFAGKDIAIEKAISIITSQ